ncbi:MAG: VWA domain-containing protein [Chloracidobacterium sp.]|nr:VWA domain-containing protein [Chloracidobacterium sp.]
MKRVLVLIAFVSVFGMQPAAQTAVPAVPDPVTVGLLIDNSGSYRSIFERVIKSANAIIEELKESDQAFVITFVDTPKIVVRQDITGNKADLRDAVENMFIEGGQTALIDGVMSATRYFDEHTKPSAEVPRVLLIITDGDERGSTASIEEAVRALKSSGIRVLVLGLYDEKIYPKLIDRMIKETNGAKFVPKTPKEVPTAVEGVISAIRSN